MEDETATVKALKAAKSLLTLDELAPAIQKFEKEKRNEARHAVIELIEAALAEQRLATGLTSNEGVKNARR